jgi:hypothetical protein
MTVAAGEAPTGRFSSTGGRVIGHRSTGRSKSWR